MQHLVIIPGVSDSTKKLTLITKNWEEKYDIRPHIVKFGWQGNDKNLNSRLKIVGKYIDNLLEEGKEVSLLGTSAGGSAVINLFYPRRYKIDKVINICGQLSDSRNISTYKKTDDITLYAASVDKCEKILNELSYRDMKKILTIKPIFDDLVPVKTMHIHAAHSKRLISTQHLLTIRLALTLHADKIADFIKTKINYDVGYNSNMQNLLIIPGIGYTVDWIKFLTRNWEKEYGIEPYVIDFRWMGDSNKYPERFEKMGAYLDELIKDGEETSILGISAGGSAVINLFYPRRDKIKKVITVCGRVHDPNVRKMWNHKPEVLGIYEESVKLCEANLNKLSVEDKKRILTIRPFYDEVVPVRTMIIDGANNQRINAVQHMMSISLAMTLFSGRISKFVNGKL